MISELFISVQQSIMHVKVFLIRTSEIQEDDSDKRPKSSDYRVKRSKQNVVKVSGRMTSS